MGIERKAQICLSYHYPQMQQLQLSRRSANEDFLHYGPHSPDISTHNTKHLFALQKIYIFIIIL
jgi:hypothetical protein